MGKDKEYNKRTLVVPEEETACHRKKSKTSSKSNIEKRSKHKHDYENVIIEGIVQKYFWGKRCRICGRVDDSGEFKPDAASGLIKKIERIETSKFTHDFKVFYTVNELKKLYPDIPILKHSHQNHKVKYEEI